MELIELNYRDPRKKKTEWIELTGDVSGSRYHYEPGYYATYIHEKAKAKKQVNSTREFRIGSNHAK